MGISEKCSKTVLQCQGFIHNNKIGRNTQQNLKFVFQYD